MKLDGKKIAILIAPRGTEEPEFIQPKEAVEKAGAAVTVVGIETGTAETVNNDLDSGGSYSVDSAVRDTSADAFDGLIIPGGCVGADTLRGNEEIIAFVRAFFEQQKPVAVICHAPWLLVEADVVRGRTLTSYPSVATDIRNAGGEWVDRECVTDRSLVTSRTPDDLEAFCARAVDEFAHGRHSAEAASA